MRGSAGDSSHAGDLTVPLSAAAAARAAQAEPGQGGPGRAGYGQPGYGQGGYGQPGYGPPGYDYQPGYQGPAGGPSAGPAAGLRGPGAPTIPGAPPGRRGGRRRIRRILGRIGILIAVLILIMIVGFGGLMVLTPSAGNAAELARAQAAAHHAVYPGPPVPAKFSKSLVATEDKRFYSEPGVDLYAFGRVAGGYLTGGRFQGGATLYQQLAKMLYTGGQSRLTNEPEQLALAIKLDLTYSKAQVLQMYAGVVYFGHGFYGLAAASCGYFGVAPTGLSWPQAAMLAGLVQGPSLDDPIKYPEAALRREAHVLGRLVATGVLTEAQATRAQRVPLSAMLAHAGAFVSRAG